MQHKYGTNADPFYTTSCARFLVPMENCLYIQRELKGGAIQEHTLMVSGYLTEETFSTLNDLGWNEIETVNRPGT